MKNWLKPLIILLVLSFSLFAAKWVFVHFQLVLLAPYEVSPTFHVYFLILSLRSHVVHWHAFFRSIQVQLSQKQFVVNHSICSSHLQSENEKEKKKKKMKMNFSVRWQSKDELFLQKGFIIYLSFLTIFPNFYFRAFELYKQETKIINKIKLAEILELFSMTEIMLLSKWNLINVVHTKWIKVQRRKKYFWTFRKIRENEIHLKQFVLGDMQWL